MSFAMRIFNQRRESGSSRIFRGARGWAPSAHLGRRHGRVLLIGGGHPFRNSKFRIKSISSEVRVASVGLVHLAAFLRRHDIETYVMTYAQPNIEDDIAEFRAALRTIKPDLVGISFKWYMDVKRCLLLGEMTKREDSDIAVALGGNSAAYYWRELMGFPFVDFVIRGDGEVPLLEICTGATAPQNAVFRDGSGVVEGPISYVQQGDEPVFISDFNDCFVSQSDRHRTYPLIVGGKGCRKECCWCSGGRAAQLRQFGRTGPHLRPAEHVRRDIQALHSVSANFMLDCCFEHPSFLDWLQRCFENCDCSRDCMFIVSWQLPSDELLDFFESRFKRVIMSIDLVAMSERHREYLVENGHLKRYLPEGERSNRDILAWLDRQATRRSVWFMVSGIGGLPFVEDSDFQAERRLAEQLSERDNVMFYFEGNRVHWEPGSPIAEDPVRFGMTSPIGSFDSLLRWYEGKGANNPYPTFRFSDKSVEKRVEHHARSLARICNRMPKPWLRRYAPSEKPNPGLVDWLLLRPDAVKDLRLTTSVCRLFSYSYDEWWGGRRPRGGRGSFVGAFNFAHELLEIDKSCFQGVIPFYGGVLLTGRDEAGSVGMEILHKFLEPARVQTVWEETRSHSRDLKITYRQFAKFVATMMISSLLEKAGVSG